MWNRKNCRSGARSRTRELLVFAITLGFVAGAPAVSLADGDETLGTPSVAISSGTDIVGAGVGLRDVTSGTINVNVPADVSQALLYWSGESFTPNLGDDAISVNGAPVVGTLIGTSVSPDGTRAETVYRADITSKVSAGANALLLTDVSFNSKNFGAGVLVIFDDGTTPTPTIDVLDGADHAFQGQPDPRGETIQQILSFPDATVDRTAKLVMMFGDTTPDRPDEIEIIIGGDTTLLVNAMASADGAQFSTVTTDVNIPAFATQLSVQAFSRDTTGFGGLPDSLLWNLLSLRVPGEADDPQLCWITGGGFIDLVDNDTAGQKSFSFGGNVGPPPRGSWQVVDHDTGDVFHTSNVHITFCEVLAGTTGPGNPGKKQGLDLNKANFAGVGTLNHMGFCPFTGYVIDAGEPQGRNDNDNDVFSLTTSDPGACGGSFSVTGELPGGNFQIHPAVGNQ